LDVEARHQGLHQAQTQAAVRPLLRLAPVARVRDGDTDPVAGQRRLDRDRLGRRLLRVLDRVGARLPGREHEITAIGLADCASLEPSRERLAQGDERTAPLDASRALRWCTIVATVLVFATIVAGGVVAGTEEEGTSSAPVVGAHLACGTEFPTCLGKFMPFSYGKMVDIQLTHRLLMYLTAIAIAAMTVIAIRRRVVLPPDGNRA